MNKVSVAFLLLISCTSVSPSPADVGAALDSWHSAASRADEETYFRLLADDAIFLGTDSSERWTKQEFLAYVHPYFAAGRGWTYVPRERNFYFSADRSMAWFEEKLDNEKYGELRGTGVLRRDKEGWRIVHYSMSFPVPNDATAEVVAAIRKQR